MPGDHHVRRGTVAFVIALLLILLLPFGQAAASQLPMIAPHIFPLETPWGRVGMILGAMICSSVMGGMIIGHALCRRLL